MPADQLDIRCPHCDALFYVVWSRQFEGEKPEHCPMCGGEMDYREAWLAMYETDDEGATDAE